MGASFGTVSRKVVEPDWLGRPQRILTVGSLTGHLPSAVAPIRFDIDDLDHLARGGAQNGLFDLDVDRRVGLMECWASWAVVFNALPAEYVVHSHSDALCTIANLPDGGSIISQLFGSAVAWLPFTEPGRPLADALLVYADEWVLVRGLGLIGRGSALDDIQARAATMEAMAQGWLIDSASSRVGDAPEMSEREAIGLLGTIRGLMSTQHRVVLSIDSTMRSIAGRRDVERVVRDARAVEMVWPWTVGAVVVRNATQASSALAPTLPAEAPNKHRDEPRRLSGDTIPTNVVVVPGIGLVTAAGDEHDADVLSTVAAHVHRVAAAIIDRTNEQRRPMPEPEPERVADRIHAREKGNVTLPFSGRVFVVTGAASGIGRDIARHLSALGASLSLADVNDEALLTTAEELVRQGRRPLTIVGDLADELVANKLVDATVLRFGGIDGVVFNAGVAIPGEIKDLSAADWRRSLEVNATSSFLLAKRVLPVLESQAIGGSVVFIGSKNMFSPGAGFGAYSASKGALAQLARVVAIEGGPFGVRSNIVNPDNVFEGSLLWSSELRAQRAAVYHIAPEELEEFYTQRNLLKVRISGLDVAKAVAFLLSDDAIRTTACVVTVDGGVPGVFPR